MGESRTPALGSPPPGSHQVSVVGHLGAVEGSRCPLGSQGKGKEGGSAGGPGLSIVWLGLSGSVSHCCEP